MSAAAELARRTREAQGLSSTIEDLSTLDRLAALVRRVANPAHVQSLPPKGGEPRGAPAA